MKTLLSFISLVAAQFSHAAPGMELWLYLSTNLQRPENVACADSLFARAEAAGYTHVLLADTKFASVDLRPPEYLENCRKIKAAAERSGLTLVPALFGLGYSNAHLHRNPNLAEGLPVKDALFVVRGGEARLIADPAVTLPGCGTQERERWKFVDTTLVSDQAAFRATVPTGNARFHAKVRVAKFRCYTISVRIRTEAFNGEPACKVLTPSGASLSYTNLSVERSQDWTTHRITFNSLDHDEISVYFGTWGPAQGTVAWREPKIEEEGLVNVLRRDGCPLIVKTEEGRTLREGVDFEAVVDRRMAERPNPGDFEVWHEAPAIRTALPDGTRLRVSFYHPHVVHKGQVCMCPSEPETNELLAKQAQNLHALWGATGYMMQHDEWRVLNWDEACLKRKLTPGVLVADNVKFCREVLKKNAPEARVHVWSDMFDPYHNAIDGYYLVNGNLRGSWEGLDPSVVIINWNFEKADQSLPFFAARGHRQILAGFYDRNPSTITSWLASARKVPGVIGVMYTTWENDYSQLEEFSRLVSEAEKLSSKAP